MATSCTDLDPEDAAAREGADEVADDNLALTSRELEVLQLVSAGGTNGDVARKLWVTEQTESSFTSGTSTASSTSPIGLRRVTTRT